MLTLYKYQIVRINFTNLLIIKSTAWNIGYRAHEFSSFFVSSNLYVEGRKGEILLLKSRFRNLFMWREIIYFFFIQFSRKQKQNHSVSECAATELLAKGALVCVDSDDTDASCESALGICEYVAEGKADETVLLLDQAALSSSRLRESRAWRDEGAVTYC